MDKVRWGILSTARHGAISWIPALKQTKRGELVAVASRHEDRAREFAAEHGIPKAYGSYEAMLADPEIDAIYIPLPNHLHKEWTIRAAEAGKHVMCEKPLGLDAAEAEVMVAAARQAGIIFAETFQWRHHPQGQTARDLVRAGRIGTLRLIEAGFSFMLNRPDDVRWNPDMGGGALYDVGCYPISLARYITGQEPTAVTAQAHWGKSGVDDSVVATLEFPGDVLAVINCGFTLPLRRYFEITGTEGMLHVNHAYNPKDDYDAQILRFGSDRELAETIPVGKHNSYTLMIEDFNDVVLDGSEQPFPPEDAVRNMRVIDAIYAAAREGRRVTV